MTTNNNEFQQRPNVGFEFELNNASWSVSSTTDRFVIATRSGIDGEPTSARDVIKININQQH